MNPPSAEPVPTNAVLGFPEDAGLLIINADDFGMCHSNNEATLQSFRTGLVSSTTLMAPLEHRGCLSGSASHVEPRGSEGIILIDYRVIQERLDG